MVNHATINETAKITDIIFIWHVWPERCHVRYITKKVDVYMWLPFVVMQLKFYLLRATQM